MTIRYIQECTLLRRLQKQYKAWMNRLLIIKSITITLFSNLLFKGVGRHPRTDKKKGSIKVYTVIHANEEIPSDIKFTSTATNDSFMLRRQH
ncbi:hypothetical protein [Phocaeicola plebeius]|uniref:hypothetical protein n=1 Tax=Phocaeicola plebeius TaxID=310297 RepID=UPI003F9CDF70